MIHFVYFYFGIMMVYTTTSPCGVVFCFHQIKSKILRDLLDLFIDIFAPS